MEEETDIVGEEDEERAGEKYGEETEGWVELVVRGVEEELEGRKTGEGDGEELLLHLIGWQGKRVIEESITLGGEGKDTVEGGMDEIAGG